MKGIFTGREQTTCESESHREELRDRGEERRMDKKAKGEKKARRMKEKKSSFSHPSGKIKERKEEKGGGGTGSHR